MIKKFGIVVYGPCKDRNDLWEAWLNETMELSCAFGHTPTHIGIMCNTINNGKIRTLRRSEKKIREIITRGEDIRHLSVYALPPDFHTAVGDDTAYFDLEFGEWAFCEMDFKNYSADTVNRIKDTLLDFVEMKDCEVFTMDKSQVLYNYVMKGSGTDLSQYPTLEILQD